MILSSFDVYNLLTADPILNSLSKVYITESRPTVEAGDQIYVYIKKYPTVSEFEASWDIWIINYSDDSLDLFIAQAKRILPRFIVSSIGEITKASTVALLTSQTVIEPTPSASEIASSAARELESKFNSLKETVEDRLLLVGPGRPGRDGIDGKDGIDGTDGKDGKDLDATEVSLGDLKDVSTDEAKAGQVLTFDGIGNWIPSFVSKRTTKLGAGLSQSEVILLEGLMETGEPMGHSNRAESTISFDDSTRTFTIAPVSQTFTVWVKSKRFVINEPRQVQILDVTGLYYVYFDENGELLYKTEFFDFASEAFVSYIYWDADINQALYVAEERHGIVLDWQTHEYLHRTRGASIASGFDILNYTIQGTGSLASDAQFDISNGTFFDEDIRIQITHSNSPTSNSFQQDLQGPARIPVLYKLNSTWKLDSATDYPLKMGSVHPYFNSFSGELGSIVEVSSNKYVNYYIVATNNLRYPVASLMGQAEYNNASDASAESFSDLQLQGFPSKEFRFLYKVTFRTSNYTNAVNAIIQSIQDIRYYSDLPSVIAP